MQAEVIRVLNYDRACLRLAVWHGVEVTAECRLEGCEGLAVNSVQAGFARRCLIILIGGKQIAAHVDRRGAPPIARLYLPFRRPPPPEFAVDLPDNGPLLDVNAYLRSLAPTFDFERLPAFLNA